MYSKLTLIDRPIKVYPFKMEVVSKIFMNLLKQLDFLLPNHMALMKVDRSDDPNYYPNHHRLGLPIRDSYSFKI